MRAIARFTDWTDGLVQDVNEWTSCHWWKVVCVVLWAILIKLSFTP